MKIIIILLTTLLSTGIHARECSSLLDFDVKTLNENTQVNLCNAYQGKVILIVNTASRCAFTDQYDSLEKLYREYKNDGLVVLGFPSNDFGQQEPGTEKQIKEFCRMTYGVQFPMFSKTHVAKGKADPLYEQLASVAGIYPKWNFHKYLIDRKGELVTSYTSAIDPLDEIVIDEVEKQIVRF